MADKNRINIMDSLNERDKIHFFDTTGLKQTIGIRGRCNSMYIEEKLSKRFQGEEIRVLSVKINESGIYRKKTAILMKLLGLGKPIQGLPPYCEVKVEHITGKFSEHITVWSPLAWNDRFAGTAGGGTGTGGDGYITAPNNTVRGWTLPFALINGFTAAMVDAGNVKERKDLMIDVNTRELNWDLFENWRAGGTHYMTVIGKAVAEILHERGVRFSYMNGGSGGGRQSMMEAQEYPEDYDGIWAACPAINWTKFILAGLWPIAVMNSNRHILTHHKIKYFISAVHQYAGGKDAYFKLEQKVEFNPDSLIGQNTKDGPITEMDAHIMREIWKGPHRKNGEQLWYGFRPGLTFWNVILPVGAFYYSLLGKKPKPFFLVTNYLRWITRDPKQVFDSVTLEEFEELFDKSITMFAKAAGDQADLSVFAKSGGKLIIDHGLNDPLIPVDGTIEYYDRMCQVLGGKEQVDKFCRLYLTPGDGHGNCWSDGPGITEADGMKVLMDWVENGKKPAAIRVVRVNKKTGETLYEGARTPV